MLAWLFFTARQAAGALGTRLSLRPLYLSRDTVLHNSGKSRREIVKLRLPAVIPGRCQRVRAKRGPMTGSASNYGAQLRI
jgi:hypothetical protein